LEKREKLKNNRWVDVPMTADVWHLLKEIRVSDTYYRRGDGQATQDLDWVEAQHRNWVKDIIDLSEFQYCYAVNGTTDAIHHWLLTEDREWQYFSGEYEYPRLIRKGSEVCNGYMEYTMDLDKVLYVSLPSAADGNFADINYHHSQYKGTQINCPVILDCTYVSSTDIQRINLPLNTEQVFFSFSKGFGLIGQRLGLVYTKKPHKSLHTLKEFENWNYGSVKTMELIMSNFAVDDMWKTHRAWQLAECESYDFEPSDCFFLATTEDPYYKMRRRMRFNRAARICLTPLIEW
jgi:hypothetical protein